MSGFLLDTMAIIRIALGEPQVSKVVRRTIEECDDGLYVSAASAWEIATKFRLGKLPGADVLAHGFRSWCVEHGMAIMPITADHAQAAGLLEGPHRDPFDRILIAQARLERLTVVSSDQVFDDYGVERLW